MTETAPDFTESSEYAQGLAAVGMQPTQVTKSDIDTMLAQMAKMQETVDRLNAERGVPIDQVDGYRQQLQAHFQAKKNSRQDTDFSAPEAALAALPENPDDITAHDTEALHFAMEQWLKKHPGKELEYLEILAGELHQTVLNREGKHGVMYKRVSELESQVADLLAQSAAWKSKLESQVADLLAQSAAWKAAQTPNG